MISDEKAREIIERVDNTIARLSEKEKEVTGKNKQFFDSIKKDQPEDSEESKDKKE